MGPMPYGITWRLMLLKVLHKPPRPIRIFIPKSQRDNRDNVVNNGIKTWGIHGSNALWDYMEINAIESLT